MLYEPTTGSMYGSNHTLDLIRQLECNYDTFEEFVVYTEWVYSSITISCTMPQIVSFLTGLGTIYGLSYIRVKDGFWFGLSMLEPP